MCQRWRTGNDIPGNWFLLIYDEGGREGYDSHLQAEAAAKTSCPQQHFKGIEYIYIYIDIYMYKFALNYNLCRFIGFSLFVI